MNLHEHAAEILRKPSPATTGDQSLEVFLEWLTESGLQLYPAQEEAILEILGGNRPVVLATGEALIEHRLRAPWSSLTQEVFGLGSIVTMP